MANTANASFDDILSTTFNKHRSTFVDTVFSARPLTYFLMQAGQIRMVDGGAKIVEPLIVSNNASVTAYEEGGNLQTLSVDNYAGGEFSAAEFDWKMVAATISVSGLEEAKNAGTSRILDLLEGKIAVARESITEFFNTAFHLSTATAPGSGAYNGLGYLVAQNTNAVGGINTASSDNWSSHLHAATGALTLAKMATAYNTVSVGNDQPNLILTTQTLYEKYESLLQPQLRYSSAQVADAGFQNLLYKGAPVLYDADTTSGVMYMLNTKYLKLIGHSDKWFTPSPFIRTTALDARVAQIFCYGQLIINNRNRQAALKAATA